MNDEGRRTRSDSSFIVHPSSLRTVSLREKIVAYFVVLHLVLAVAAAFVLMENRLLLFAVEGLFIVSILIATRLIRMFFVPLDLIRTGAELIAERDFTSRFVPVGQPEMDRLIAVYNAMIDRLREERLAAEEQQQLLQRIVQASPSGIVICDFEGQVQQANPAAERLLAEPGVRAAMETLARDEWRLVGLAGARRLRILRAEFRDRGFAKRFFVIEELTEELRLTEKAAYEKLIRMMSHEVNNSVGAVRSLLESLLRYAGQVGADDRDDFVSALTIASARIDNLNHFMGGFADVVRLPAPQPTDTNLGQVLSEIVTLLRPEAARRGITINVDVDREGVVHVDRNQFEQVVLNVLRNAMESIGEQGTIDVTWRGRVLTIADSGHGIDPRDEPELFTPFFTTKREGRGLGLTLVGEILNNHRLRFTLANRDGGGAEFRVWV
jgi:two-component system nitrogen regulation sensor histidine kinase NtrY